MHCFSGGGGLTLNHYLFSVMIYFSQSFVRVNLASVSIHYHVSYCSLSAEELPFAHLVGILLFFCGLIISSPDSLD